MGVLFDEDLKFSEHAMKQVNKANQRLGLVKRTFSNFDRKMFIPLYKSLIRPHLEYATVVWNPVLKKDIIAIENVQRRATKLITGFKEKSYENRLKNWEFLPCTIVEGEQIWYNYIKL